MHEGANFSHALDGALRCRDVRAMDMRWQPPRIFALAGIIEPFVLLGGSVVFGALRPGYDASHAISELGQQGSAYAVVWNVVGFGGAALLYALFAVAVGAALGRGWLFRLVAFQAASLAAGGVFSCDPGCPPMMSSWQGWAHTVAGLAYFAATCVVPLVAWRTFRRSTGWRSLAPVSLVAGVVLIGLFLVGPILFGPDLVGLWQRITLAIAGAWAATVALRLWRLPSTVAEGRQRSDPAQARTAADLP